MKKIFILLFTLLLTNTIFCQVTIGSKLIPNKNAILDLQTNDDNSSTKGLLLPRVALVTTNSSTPLTAHVNGMLVYNTATIDTEIFPGCYYNDGENWIRVGENENILTASNGLTKTDDNITLGGEILAPTTISGITSNNKLSFIGSGQDAVNVLNTISFDATSKKVGIGDLNNLKTNGIITPNETLDVQGTARISTSKNTAANTITGRDSNGNITNVKLGNALYLEDGTLSFGAEDTEVHGYDIIYSIKNINGTNQTYVPDKDTTIWVANPPTPNEIGANIMLPTKGERVGRAITIISAFTDTNIGVYSLESTTNESGGFITVANGNNTTVFKIPSAKRATFQYIGNTFSPKGTWVVTMKDF